MTTPLEQFQKLLHDLFQFDCADLDFGIYRIINYKRQVIEKWIAEDLPRAISDELKRGTLRNGRTVAVIWRETQSWTEEDYARDRDFVAAQRLTERADEVFVNGDSLIPGAQSLDPIFEERMFAGVQVNDAYKV